MALAGLALVSGCASIPPQAVELEPGTASLELVDTPFYPQEQYQCGPASLATALSSSGVAVELDDLVGRVYLPGKKGSLQVEMLGATRMSGRIPYRVDGRLQAVRDELAAGRPVVVLQNLGIAAIPRWHYAVVIGIDTQSDDIVLRSGTDRRRITGSRTFLKTWQRSEYWGFVALRPDELPANVNRGRYFEAIADLESAGQLDEASIAWQTALQKWPADPVALFGLGNTRLKGGDAAAAEKRFREALQQDPGAVVARNNLAIALAKQGRFDDALNELSVAIADNSDVALDAELADTEAVIQKMSRSAANSN